MIFKSIALTGTLAVSVSAALPGCYPAWMAGSTYSIGSLVSASVLVNATAGTTKTKNFECTSGTMPTLSHCPNYDPSNTIQAAAAWADNGECTRAIGIPSSNSSNPTNISTSNAWSDADCPKAWAEGTNYEGGDLAAVNGVVYKCSEARFVNKWCGDSNYKPSDSLFWETAWTRLGPCSVTIVPISSPNNISLKSIGGCPDAFKSSAEYEAGDKVEVNGIAYQCRAWPNSAWCDKTGYEPDGNYSSEAWTRLGYCDGKITPTGFPNFLGSAHAAGCPDAYIRSSDYEAYDQVSVNGIVYECKVWPDSGYCNTYEPGHSSKLGWQILGYCKGTISPTKNPSSVKLANSFGCPEEYKVKTEYQAGEHVSVKLDGFHSLVYTCSSDIHISKYCSIFEPGNQYGFGWSLTARCDGTIAPSTAPVWSSLNEVGDGCPAFYNKASTYKQGDLVAVFTKSDIGLVYECKEWPVSAYCNAGPIYAPGTAYGNMGWNVRGYCRGSMAPTSAPIPWTETCLEAPWALSDLSFYEDGARVRKSNRIYECRVWPRSLWCKMAAYEPENSLSWQEAWSYVGECEPVHEATVTIEGALIIDTGSTVSIEGLAESETSNLILSTQDAIEDVACSGFPESYIMCTVDILSFNDHPVSRLLRSAHERKLVRLITLRWIVQITFPTRDDWSDAKELADLVTATVSNDLNVAIRDGSLVTSLVMKANTSTVTNLIPLSSSSATLETLPTQVELRSASRTGLSGGFRCSRDNQCASNNCRRGGGSCRWPKKCCESIPSTKKPTAKPTAKPSTANPTAKPSTVDPTAVPTPCTAVQVTMSSPLNSESYSEEIFNDFSPGRIGSNKFCYNNIFKSAAEGPTTAQLLVMFRENFVEHQCRVYASLTATTGKERDFLPAGGLYEVVEDTGSCVTFRLLYEDDTLGQIVATSQFDPIKIIGVSGSTIYGYYPSSYGGTWLRKQTAWGDAADGSLSVEPQLNGVAGLTSNGRLFHLWGDFSNFNYAKHDNTVCRARPAEISDWTGSLAESRGLYCPKQDTSQLIKYSWHPSGSTTTDLGGGAAKKIGRLSPTSNIYGISTDGKMFVLWNDSGVALDLGPDLTGIQAVGGVDNGYQKGVFVINNKGRVYNVYSDGQWKAKEIRLENREDGFSAWFGNFNDKTYMLYKIRLNVVGIRRGWVYFYFLYRLDFVDGEHTPVLVGERDNYIGNIGM